MFICLMDHILQIFKNSHFSKTTFFLLKEKFSFDEISQRAIEIYGDLFSDKLFRSQLSFFEDVDYSEEVDYIIPDPPSDDEIKRFLVEVSTAIK